MAEMTLLEAIQARHSVRKYKDEPIPEEVLAVLRNKVWEINRQAGLHIQLVTGEPKAFSGPMAYGSFSGVKNFWTRKSVTTASSLSCWPRPWG